MYELTLLLLYTEVPGYRGQSRDSVRFSVGAGIFLFAMATALTLRPAQPVIQEYRRLFPSYLVPKLGIRGFLLPSPKQLHGSMLKHGATLSLHTYIHMIYRGAVR
jgi:hypothetical protein